MSIIIPSSALTAFGGVRRGLLSDSTYSDLKPILKSGLLQRLILPTAPTPGLPSTIDFTNKQGHCYGTDPVRCSWTASSIVKSAADAAFNNKDVISFTGRDGDLNTDFISVGKSYAVMMAVSLSADALSPASGFAQLWMQYLPASNTSLGSIRVRQSTNNLECTVNGALGTIKLDVSTYLPAADVPFMIMLDYDDDRKLMRAWMNDVTPVATLTSTVANTELYRQLFYQCRFRRDLQNRVVYAIQRRPESATAETRLYIRAQLQWHLLVQGVISLSRWRVVILRAVLSVAPSASPSAPSGVVAA